MGNRTFYHFDAASGQWQLEDLPTVNESPSASNWSRVSLVQPMLPGCAFIDSVGELVKASMEPSDAAGQWRLAVWEYQHWRLAHLDFLPAPTSGSEQPFTDCCRRLCESSDFDYLVWPGQETPALLVFDMDSTFIEIEVIDELAKRAGIGDKVAAVTERAMRGELDFAESLRHRVACLKGLSAEVIAEIAASLPLSPGVDILVQRADAAGAHSAIVSGGFMPFVEKLKSQLPIWQVKANRLVVHDNRLTGEVEGEIVDANYKAHFLRALAQQLGILPEQVIAVGDGANDLKMMAEAGFSLAYRAKPSVQAQARGRFNQATLDVLAALWGW